MIIAVTSDSENHISDFEKSTKIIFFETENSLIVSETEFMPKSMDTEYISSQFKSKSVEVFICKKINDTAKNILLSIGIETVHEVDSAAKDAAITYLCGKRLGISEMR